MGFSLLDCYGIIDQAASGSRLAQGERDETTFFLPTKDDCPRPPEKLGVPLLPAHAARAFAG